MVLENSLVTELSWLSQSHPLLAPRTDQAKAACSALSAYLESAGAFPQLAIRLKGSQFQLKVWNALQQIPSGTTVTYGQLARKLDSSSRAIGQACRTNPIAIVVPCHRVVSATGLGGYMGREKQLNIKQWLLQHERADVN